MSRLSRIISTIAALTAVASACETSELDMLGPPQPPDPPPPTNTSFTIAQPPMRLIQSSLNYQARAYSIGGNGCPVANTGSQIMAAPTTTGLGIGARTVVDVSMDGCPTATAAGVDVQIAGLSAGSQNLRWTGGGDTKDQEIHVGGGTPNFQHLDYMKFAAQFKIRASQSTCPGVVDADPDPIEDIETIVVTGNRLKFGFKDGAGMIASQRDIFITAESEAPVPQSNGDSATETWSGTIDWQPMTDPYGSADVIISGTWLVAYALANCTIGGPFELYTAGWG